MEKPSQPISRCLHIFQLLFFSLHRDWCYEIWRINLFCSIHPYLHWSMGFCSQNRVVIMFMEFSLVKYEPELDNQKFINLLVYQPIDQNRQFICQKYLSLDGLDALTYIIVCDKYSYNAKKLFSMSRPRANNDQGCGKLAILFIETHRSCSLEKMVHNCTLTIYSESPEI